MNISVPNSSLDSVMLYIKSCHVKKKSTLRNQYVT